MLFDIGYVAIGLAVAQRLFASGMKGIKSEFGEIESVDIIFGSIISIILAVFWPAVVVVYGIYRLALRPIVESIRNEDE